MLDLHLGAVREVSSWDVMLLLYLGENDRKLVDQIVFLAFFAKNGWHLLLQVADNMSVSLGGNQMEITNRVTPVCVNVLDALTLTKRDLFTRSFSLRTAALRGRFLMSANRSSSSNSIKW